MTSKSDQIRQQNLNFIYNRNSSDSKYDLDKRAYVKSAPKLNIKTIDNFIDDYYFLNPIYPCSVQLNDEFYSMKYFPSFEHALQASKFAVDDPKRDEIRSIKDIKEVKRVVNACSFNFESWKSNCLLIGERLLRDKFFRNKQLKSLLMKTKLDGYEQFSFKNSYNDMFWGVVEPSKKSVLSGLSKEGELIGSNHLGSLLLKIREEIYSGDDTDNWILQNCIHLEPSENVNIQILCFKPSTQEITNEDKPDSIVGKVELVQVTDECKLFKKMNMVFLGKTDESNYIAAHPRYL